MPQESAAATVSASAPSGAASARPAAMMAMAGHAAHGDGPEAKERLEFMEITRKIGFMFRPQPRTSGSPEATRRAPATWSI
jgi:hypothetical protein